MDSNERQRKDRLIQTRVPQNLENTLKDEARKRRLSVSHLIRNVLEDTFNLVDNVVSEVDRVVADSVGMAQTLKRDAQRLAATARGQTAHRERDGEPRTAGTDEVASNETPASDGLRAEPSAATEDDSASVEPSETRGSAREPNEEAAQPPAGKAALANVYGFQELVLNRPAQCASCGVAIVRGARAFLGMTDAPGPRIWVCQDCVDALPD
jgi:hypothetical protein